MHLDTAVFLITWVRFIAVPRTMFTRLACLISLIDFWLLLNNFQDNSTQLVFSNHFLLMLYWRNIYTIIKINTYQLNNAWIKSDSLESSSQTQNKSWDHSHNQQDYIKSWSTFDFEITRYPNLSSKEWLAVGDHVFGYVWSW